MLAEQSRSARDHAQMALGATEGLVFGSGTFTWLTLYFCQDIAKSTKSYCAAYRNPYASRQNSSYLFNFRTTALPVLTCYIQHIFKSRYVTASIP